MQAVPDNERDYADIRTSAELLIKILAARLDVVTPGVKDAILRQVQTDPQVIFRWLDEAIQILDADAAMDLVRKIAMHGRRSSYADVRETELTYYGRVEFNATLKTLREDLLDVLAARDLAVPEEVRARILATRDLALLKEWITRAVTISSADQLFA